MWSGSKYRTYSLGGPCKNLTAAGWFGLRYRCPAKKNIPGTQDLPRRHHPIGASSGYLSIQRWINSLMLFASSQRLYVHACVNKKKKIWQAWSGHDLLSLLDEAVLPLQASIPSREGKTRVAERGMSDIPLSWKSEASAPVQLLKTQPASAWERLDEYGE